MRARTAAPVLLAIAAGSSANFLLVDAHSLIPGDSIVSITLNEFAKLNAIAPREVKTIATTARAATLVVVLSDIRTVARRVGRQDSHTWNGLVDGV